MAAKPKAEAPPADDKDENADADSNESAEAAPKETKKAGLVGRILGPVMGIARFANPLAILKLPLKQKLIAAAALLVVLLGGGAGVYFLMGSSAKDEAQGPETVRT